MIILINPNACGGTALRKWNTIKPELLNKLNNPELVFLNGRQSMHALVKDALIKGETEFISAGGDGTLNLMLNSIINMYGTDRIDKIKVGAVGLGSSNDFYKPFAWGKLINNIPVKIDFEKPSPRDVGKITFTTGGRIKTKYFLINSSIGLTAEANYLFNNPDKILSSLKRKSTSSAIIYTALKKILNYKNFNAEITSGETGRFITRITNLGIVKNPNFSGGMNYGCEADYRNGLFNVHLCYEMNMPERLNLFRALNSGKFEQIKKTKSWTTDKLTVKSSGQFAVEYDGEIIRTDKVEFSVLPSYIKVCG